LRWLQQPISNRRHREPDGVDHRQRSGRQSGLGFFCRGRSG
jgi:hypothetical protein